MLLLPMSLSIGEDLYCNVLFVRTVLDHGFERLVERALPSRSVLPTHRKAVSGLMALVSPGCRSSLWPIGTSTLTPSRRVQPLVGVRRTGCRAEQLIAKNLSYHPSPSAPTTMRNRAGVFIRRDSSASGPRIPGSRVAGPGLAEPGIHDGEILATKRSPPPGPAAHVVGSRRAQFNLTSMFRRFGLEGG